MLPYHTIASLNVGAVRILLPPEARMRWFGSDLAGLPAETALLQHLSDTSHRADDQRRLFSTIGISALDINTADVQELTRVAQISRDLAQRFIEARPYFSMRAAIEQWPELADTLRGAQKWLNHAGYLFPDKPQGWVVSLNPDPERLVVRYSGNVSVDDARFALQAAGLREIQHIAAARILCCAWTIDPPQRAARWREMKRSPSVEAAGPAFEHPTRGQIFAHFDRMDVRLHNGREAAWQNLLSGHQLSTVQMYMDGYGAAKLNTHPHDLGALYRVMRQIALETDVRFVEPTWLSF